MRARRPATAAPATAAPAARDQHTAEALDALRRVVRALRRAAATAEADAGLSAAQLFVLAQVAAAPGQSLTALAARTHTDRTSVAAAVARLETRGLVRRSAAAADRRRAEVHPTDAGRRVLAGAPHPPTRRLLDGMARLGDAELGGLAAALARLADAMGLAGAPAPMLFDDEPARPAPRRRR